MPVCQRQNPTQSRRWACNRAVSAFEVPEPRSPQARFPAWRLRWMWRVSAPVALGEAAMRGPRPPATREAQERLTLSAMLPEQDGHLGRAWPARAAGLAKMESRRRSPRAWLQPATPKAQVCSSGRTEGMEEARARPRGTALRTLRRCSRKPRPQLNSNPAARSRGRAGPPGRRAPGSRCCPPRLAAAR